MFSSRPRRTVWCFFLLVAICFCSVGCHSVWRNEPILPPSGLDLINVEEPISKTEIPTGKDRIVVLMEYGSATEKFLVELPQPASVARVLKTLGLKCFGRPEIDSIWIERPEPDDESRYQSTWVNGIGNCDEEEIDHQLRNGDWLRIVLRVPPSPTLLDRVVARCLTPWERWFGYPLLTDSGIASPPSVPRDPNELAMPFTTIGE